VALLLIAMAAAPVSALAQAQSGTGAGVQPPNPYQAAAPAAETPAAAPPGEPAQQQPAAPPAEPAQAAPPPATPPAEPAQAAPPPAPPQSAPPAEPAQAAPPAAPVQTPPPAEPAQAAPPAEPAEPARVAQPVEPEQPAQSAQPGQPAAPPVTANAPSEPPALPPGSEPAIAPPPAAAAQPAEPVALTNPKVVDTATLEGDGKTLRLFGVAGLNGTAADGLKSYIASNGDRLTCQPHDNGEYVCVLPDGTDVAMAALINGAAQTRGDSPEAYNNEQTLAQEARRGVWSSLPPPPVPVKHPTVQDTATLVADNQSYALDGIEGIGGDYARSFQGYIAANGDSLLCQPQGGPDNFVCLLPDGTDVAKVALVNGAARVTADAPDAYRAQQADAFAHHRGIWQNATVDTMVDLPPPPIVVVPGDEFAGLVYVDGVPTAEIDGQTVFFAYADGLGWGYWDPGHHWHGAPAQFSAHLDHFHPAGAGLRGFASRSVGGGGGAGAGQHGGVAQGQGGHPGVGQTGGRPVAGGQGGRPATGQAGAGRVGAPSAGGVARPGVAGQGTAGHPGGAGGAVAARQAAPNQGHMAAAPGRAATPFVRPSGPSTFNRPNNFARQAPMAHSMPAARPVARAAPAVRCKAKC
jgi:endonuclease YncB( thermonuclease family)